MPHANRSRTPRQAPRYADPPGLQIWLRRLKRLTADASQIDRHPLLPTQQDDLACLLHTMSVMGDLLDNV